MNDKQISYLKTILVALIMLTILTGTVIGNKIGAEDAKYEREMCNNLDINDPVEFDLDIEISANTQKDCYKANHYKYFDFGYKLGGIIVGFFIGGFIGCILFGIPWLWIDSNYY